MINYTGLHSTWFGKKLISLFSHLLLSATTWPCQRERSCGRTFPRDFPSGHDDVIKWKHFRVTGPLCREFTGPGEFPTQRPVTWSFDVFFDLRLNKTWFRTPSWSLWRHCNGHPTHQQGPLSRVLRGVVLFSLATKIEGEEKLVWDNWLWCFEMYSTYIA